MEQEVIEQEFMNGWCKLCNKEHKFVTKARSEIDVVGCGCPITTTREAIKKYPVVTKDLSSRGFWDLHLKEEEE